MERTRLTVPGPSRWLIQLPDVDGYGWPGDGESWTVLGYSQDDTTINISAYYEPWYSLESGPRMPMDMEFLGESASLSGVIMRSNEEVLQAIVNLRNLLVSNPEGDPGSGEPFYVSSPGQIGKMVVGHELLFGLGIVSVNAMYDLSGRQVSGYHFPYSFLSTPYSAKLSARAKRTPLGFQAICIPTWTVDPDDPTGVYNNVATGPKYTLYYPWAPIDPIDTNELDNPVPEIIPPGYIEFGVVQENPAGNP